MSARYLLRFDDICPTMNWQAWREIEDTLREHQLKPVLAVVPDNRDPQLQVDAPHKNFWEQVRLWQSWGWTIGLHGYQHLYSTGDAGLLRLNARSEFSGLSRHAQEEKLKHALAIFAREQIVPQVWIAPAHSFDEITVALLRQLGVRAISDGFFLYPHRDTLGMFWLPQQLWRFRKFPFGVWTICLHHNHWTPQMLARFRAMLATHRRAFTNFEEMQTRYDSHSRAWYDQFMANAWRAALKLKRALQVAAPIQS